MDFFSNTSSVDYSTNTDTKSVENEECIQSSNDYISISNFQSQISDNSTTTVDLDSLVDDIDSSLVSKASSASVSIEEYGDDFSYYDVLSTLFDIVNSDEYNDSSYLTEEDIINLVGTMDIDEYNDFINGIEEYYHSQSVSLDQQIKNYDKAKADIDDIYNKYSGYISDNGLIKVEKDNVIKEIEFSFNDINKPPYYEESYYPEGTEDSLIISKEEYEYFLNEMTDEEQYEWLQHWFPNLAPYYEKYLKDKKDYTDILLSSLKEKGYEDIKISSIDEFLVFYKELNEENFKDYALKCKQEADNAMKSAYYDYLYYLKDYQEFSSSFSFEEPTEVELKDFRIYSYEEFKKVHPDCTPIRYLEIAKKSGIPIKSILIPGIDNVEQLNDLLEIAPYSPEFIKAYSYILKTNDEKRINDFFEYCEYEINNIKGQILAQNFLSKLDEKDSEYDAIKFLANELNVTAEGLEDGLNNFGAGIYYSLESFMVGIGVWEENRARTPEDYKKMYILEALLSNKAKEALGLIYKDEDGNYQNSNLNSILDFTKTYSGVLLNSNYEISQGIGNMFPSMAIGLACPMVAPLGSIAMGISAGGNAYHSAMVEGHSYLSSFAYGIMSGASEAFTEWTFGGIFGLSDIDITSWTTYFQSMLREGGQEMLQGTLDELIFKSTILGEKIPTKPEEWLSFGLDTLKQGVYGAITAGILNVTSIPRILSQSNDENVIYYENGDSERKSHDDIVKWRNDVYHAKYKSEVDGIMFISQTQEGINQLIDYYNSTKSNTSTSSKFFIENLKPRWEGEQLWLTDIPMKDDDSSFCLFNIVYFDPDTISGNDSHAFYHEVGHYYDRLGMRHRKIQNLVSLLMGEDYNSYFTEDKLSHFADVFLLIKETYKNQFKNNIDSHRVSIENKLATQYDDFYNWSEEKRQHMIDVELNHSYNNYIITNMRESGYAAISDILDAITGGKLYDDYKCGGHGSDYYQNSDKVATEILANVSSLYNSDANLNLLYLYLPEEVCNNLVRIYEDVVSISKLDQYLGDDNPVEIVNDFFTFMELDESVLDSVEQDEVLKYIRSCSKDQINAYLVSSRIVEPYLDYSMSTVDASYGEGYFLNVLKQYLSSGDIITLNDSNICNYIKLLPKDRIIHYLIKHGC